jgi:hypothetical protein
MTDNPSNLLLAVKPCSCYTCDPPVRVLRYFRLSYFGYGLNLQGAPMFVCLVLVSDVGLVEEKNAVQE